MKVFANHYFSAGAVWLLVVLMNATSLSYQQNQAAETDPVFQYTPTVAVYGDKKPDVRDAPINKMEVPEGMLFIPGGSMLLGSEEGMDESPRMWVHLAPVFMDATEVTVAQFRKFVEATGYKTEAETFGNSGVFYQDKDNWWRMVDGANWEYPEGPDQPRAADDHPVTQVSWNDAAAYAKWAGKRLPSEVEWEHAARNDASPETQYSWGNEAVENGKWKLNSFQGSFPEKNVSEDGFLLTAPVGSFGRSSRGLADMCGNVWEWCADSRIRYDDLKQGKFEKANAGEKAMRGGSFLCEVSRCHGYRVSARSFTSPETSLMHIGFRCVKDIPAP